MLISIITINLNNASGLSRTIGSVLSQSSKNFEYIVVDGGSEDESKSVVDAISSRLAHFIFETDSGIYDAMNKGLRAASGDYCLFLNSGDMLCDDYTIDRVVGYLLGTSADVVYGNLRIVDASNSIFIKKPPDQLSLYYLLTDYVPHPSAFIRRSLLDAANGFSEEYRIVSDWVFFLSAWIGGRQFEYLDQDISTFHLGGVSSIGLNKAVEQERALNSFRPSLTQDYRYSHDLKTFYSSRFLKCAYRIWKLVKR